MANFLLTYTVPVPYEGVHSMEKYDWFESEEQMKEFVYFMRKQYGNSFKVNEAMEILDDRRIVID